MQTIALLLAQHRAASTANQYYYSRPRLWLRRLTYMSIDRGLCFLHVFASYCAQRSKTRSLNTAAVNVQSSPGNFFYFRYNSKNHRPRPIDTQTVGASRLNDKQTCSADGSVPCLVGDQRRDSLYQKHLLFHLLMPQSENANDPYHNWSTHK